MNRILAHAARSLLTLRDHCSRSVSTAHLIESMRVVLCSNQLSKVCASSRAGRRVQKYKSNAQEMDSFYTNKVQKL